MNAHNAESAALAPASRVRPPFAYFGGKTTMAPRIASLLPDHRHYVEPFAGSLAVLLAKTPSKLETVNDIDGDLMLFWRVLRNRTDGQQLAELDKWRSIAADLAEAIESNHAPYSIHQPGCLSCAALARYREAAG